MGREWGWSRKPRRGGSERAAAPAGCMSSVFHLFDLQQLLFRTTAAAEQQGRAEGVSVSRPAGRATSPGGGQVGGRAPAAPELYLPAPPLPGVVAPRNSLELDDEAGSPPSAITVVEEYDGDAIPIGVSLNILGKKKKKKMSEQIAGLSPEAEEEGRSVEGAKATRPGSVVARLMGLDQMPDVQSPRSSTGCYSPELLYATPARSARERSRSCRRDHPSRRDDAAATPPPRHPLRPRCGNVLTAEEGRRHGTRSLPDSPRMSTARRSSDAEPRLSLQLNYKENGRPSAAGGGSKYLRTSAPAPGSGSLSLSPVLAKSKKNAFLQQLEENRSPSRNAQEIIKLVRENAAAAATRRKASRDDADERLVGKAPEKKMAAETKQGRTPTTTAPVCSPRLGLPENSPNSMNKPATVADDEKHVLFPSPKILSGSPPPPSRPSTFLATGKRELTASAKASTKQPAAASGKTKKANSERFMGKIGKKAAMAAAAAAHEESFLASPRKKCRPSIPAFVPGIHKAPAKAPPAPPQPAANLSSPPILREISDQLLRCGEGNSGREQCSIRRASAGPEEYHYMRCILERTGLQSRAPPPFAAAKWYSPSHPVDPIIFHQLERLVGGTTGPLRHRCNRKLLFHLVDEILADLLRPVLHHTRPWIPRRRRRRPGIPDGESLMQRLWSQIRSYYPSAECRALRDIDALLEADLPPANVRRLLLHPAVEEESGSVAAELAADILDSLVGEAAAAMLPPRPGPHPPPSGRSGA